MKILGNVIKSKSDNRIYKAIKLKNEIQCLIISDQQAKKSSAAMSVGVGSLQDPIEAQGLAHYLQHMLFMGTKKYPNQNDYSNFIAKNFGVSNAYTSQEETNYHFEVASNAFKQTLDRFAQFFISPLMSESSSERQLNAVHSQHIKNLLNDNWKKYQLQKHLSKQDHPFKKFSTGNKQSLSNPNLRQMLHRFYNQYYSSNLMKLVVCGNQSPDQMSKIVEETFSQVPNKNYPRYKISQAPYAKQFYHKLYKIFPIQDKKVLQLTWTLTNKSNLYENPPSTYISYVIGHQGEGSLLSYLIKEGLATGLSAGGHDSLDCYSQFNVRVSLTNKGVENVKKVAQYILYLVDILKKMEPQKWVYDQLKDVNRMKFDFLQKIQGMQFTSSLAKKLQKRKIQQVLVYPYYMKQWRPDTIKQYLNELKSQNLAIFLQAKQVQKQCKLIEPIYQTKYTIESLDNLEPQVCPISFPPKNPYLPKNLQVLPLGQQLVPQILLKNEQYQVYFKKDHKFQLPKMLIKLRLCFLGSNSVKEALCRRIFLDMLNQRMREFVYLGDSAGTLSSLEFQNYYTFDFNYAGFRDSVLKFVKPHLQKVFSFTPQDASYFETCKQKTHRALSNYFLGDPFRIAYGVTTMATRQGLTTSPSQQLKQIKNINFQDIINFGKQWRQKLYIQGLITGNLQKSQAQQILQQVRCLVSKFQLLPRSQIPDIRPIKLPSNFVWAIQQKIKNTKEQNSSVVVHFQHVQDQAYSIRAKLLQDLCYNFVKEPAFDYLRTKQQLGYIVMCLPDDNRGVLGMSILLQSAIKTSYQLIQYINIFTQKILKQKLSNLTESVFAQYKTSLKISKLQPPKTLIAQSSRFWLQQARHSYLFNRTQLQIKELETITLEQLRNFIHLLFYLNAKRLQVHIISHKDINKNQILRKQRSRLQPNFRVFSDVELFKKKMSLYPDFYSHL